MRIRQIRSATLVIEYDGKRFLTDPWLQGKGPDMDLSAAIAAGLFLTPVTELPCPLDEITAGLDAILLTHIHGDHYDHAAAEVLDHSLPVFTNDDESRQMLERDGFTHVLVTPAEGICFGEITIVQVEGRHGTREQNAGPACGFVLKAPGEKVLYLAGDTVFYEGVEANIQTHAPDVIVVNACGAAFEDGTRMIMDDVQVNALCRFAPGKVIIASHMGAVRHATVTRNQLREALAREGHTEQVRIPEDGEWISV